MSDVRRLKSVNPANPDDVIVDASSSSPADVAVQAERARVAQAAWAAESSNVRANALSGAANALRSASDEFTELTIREVGKPRTEARAEHARAASILEYFAQQALDPSGETYTSPSGLLFTQRRPRGLAGLITPWNFPMAIPIWKVAPALAAGNGVLLKPSTQALATAQILVEVLDRYLPKDLLQLVPGEQETAEALIDHADLVSFTGSTVVGRSVAARSGARGIPVQAELGGQNAAIVLPDAEPDTTAPLLAAAAMGYAGQKCTATRRVIVVGGSTKPWEDALERSIQELPLGDPGLDATAVGPVISETAQSKFHAAIRLAERDGATVLADGAKLPEVGYYVRPSIITGLSADHPLLQEETFGPLVAIIAVDTVHEAIAVANGTQYGLAASVHGESLRNVIQVANSLDAGLIKINAPTTGVDYQLPFGGQRSSSIGPREQGKAAMVFYTSSHTVTIAG
jgi:acyl-CoA reductase-like NAD-dependent aldehyde dehydrogenase